MTESPETFDVEAWLTDAALPEESATVYKRGDVIAELTDLKRRIELAQAEEVEVTAAQKSASYELEKEYERLLHAFSDSALTVYVRALPQDDIAEMRASHDKRTEGMAHKEANVEFGYDLLAAAIVAVKEPGKDRQPVTFTPAAVRALEKRIGSVQLTAILEARQKAQNAEVSVDADFLRRRSGISAGSLE